MTDSAAAGTAIATGAGTVLLRSPKNAAKTGDTFTFVVTSVSLAGYTYDSASNVETQDSITVP